MVEGDQEMALVFGAVAVRVADEGALPVVVEVVVGDGDEVAGVCDIEEPRVCQFCVRYETAGELPVIVIFVVVLVGRELVVVNPDVRRLLDCYLPVGSVPSTHTGIVPRTHQWHRSAQ